MAKQIQVPEKLLDFQRKFAVSMKVPFKWENKRNSYQKDKFNTDVVNSINSDDLTDNVTRMCTYNQQYWFRFFNMFQTNYPLLAWHLGYFNFNIMITRYLDQYPPQTFRLLHISDDLPEFMEQDHEWNTELNKKIVELAYYKEKSFTLKNFDNIEPDTLSEANIQEYISKPLKFQNSFKLFEEEWNIVESRIAIEGAKTEKDKESVQLKPTEKNHWVFFRMENTFQRIKVSYAHYLLLKNLVSGMLLEEACEQTAEALNEEDLHDFETNLSNWTNAWVQLYWIVA